MPTTGVSSWSDDRVAELAALADGTLTGARRERAQARVDASPELQALLAEQLRALEIIRSVRHERAPRELRERISLLRP